MDSPEMDAPTSNVVVKTEDVVSAFLEYLVDPLLPSYMVEEAPSIVKQLDVAKQVLLFASVTVQAQLELIDLM